MFQIKVVEEIKTDILCPAFFSPENRAVYEMMWKNIVQSDRPHMTVWHKRISRWRGKATDTHSEYVILIAFLLQQWLHERALVLGYAYIAWLVFLSQALLCTSISATETKRILLSEFVCVCCVLYYMSLWCGTKCRVW